MPLALLYILCRKSVLPTHSDQNFKKLSNTDPDYEHIRKFSIIHLRVKLRRFSWSRITHESERSRFMQKPRRVLVPLLR